MAHGCGVVLPPFTAVDDGPSLLDGRLPHWAIVVIAIASRPRGVCGDLHVRVSVSKKHKSSLTHTQDGCRGGRV